MKTAKAKLASLKKEEKVVFKPVSFFGTADEAKNILMLTAAELEKPGLMLSFTLKDIVHLVPAELNAEFFEKVYPGMNLETWKSSKHRSERMLLQASPVKPTSSSSTRSAKHL